MANLVYFSSKRIPNYMLLILILLANVILGYSLVHQNYNIIIFFFSIFLVLIVVKSNVIPIVILLSIPPFFDWAVEYSFIPQQIMWIPEILAGMLFIKALVSKLVWKEKVNLFGMKIVLVFLTIGFISIIYNSTNLISAFLFLRLLLRYYLLFLAVLNLDIDEEIMRMFNKIIVFIFIAQLILSIVKLFVYGQGEISLGLSSHSVSTIFPLIAIGFLLAYYFLYKRLKIYILLILGFIGFALIGGKRAFVFFLPVLLMFLLWFLKDNFKLMFKYVVLGILIVSVSTYFSIKLMPTLNPQREIGGEFNPKHVLDYVYNYTTGVTDSGMSIGRMSATISIFNQLYQRGINRFLLGFGPGNIMKSAFQSYDESQQLRAEYGIGYGMSGLNWLALQVGYLGTFIYLLLYYFILRKSIYYFKKETEPYWRGFGLGMSAFSFIMLLLSLLYMTSFTVDAISAFYFCLAGFVLKRLEGYEMD